MKTIKRILIVLGIIILIPLVLALFVSNEYYVERSVEINRPKEHVYGYISHLKNHDNFSVWSKMDPAMKKEFRGEDATVGFVSAWDSQDENVGTGEQEIKKLNDGSGIETELRFIKPFEARAQANMFTETSGNGKTKVTWNFRSKMPYPMNIMLLFMNMDEMLGKDLQQGLNNLKMTLESAESVSQN